MCSIIGTYNVDKDTLLQMFKKLSYRGRDGYGYFVYGERDTKIFKSLDNPETAKAIEFFDTPIICLANSRSINTTEYEIGAVNDISSQQPFMDSEERFVVVHNGGISNDKELIKEYNLKVSSKVDSAMLPVLFKEVGVVNGLRKLKGNYAIVCFDKKEKKLYAAKNFMPLGIIKVGKHGVAFVSIKEMAKDIGRDFTELNNYSCLEFDLNMGNVKEHNLYPKPRNKKVLVICSSGIDSTTTAFLYKRLGYEVGLLHFLYGQAAQECELFCVEKIAKKLDAKLFVYDAREIFKPFKNKSLLLNRTKADKKVQMLDAESTLSYVPNRNSIMASVGAALAEMNGYDVLGYGGQMMDSAYIDNTPGYVEKVDALLKYSLNWDTNIKFTAPLIHLNKHEIVELGQKMGIDYEEYSCSCYYPKMVKGKVKECLECGCCSYKITALNMIKEKERITNIDEFINKYVKEFT